MDGGREEKVETHSCLSWRGVVEDIQKLGVLGGKAIGFRLSAIEVCEGRDRYCFAAASHE